MNQYKIEIYNGETFIDISRLVDTNIQLLETKDLTFDSSNLVIPHAQKSYIDMGGIDFSKPIKPSTPVKITINELETYRFYTTDSTRSIVAKGKVKRYRHEISLIEPTKELMRKVIPDMTITQPKSLSYINSDSATLATSKSIVNNSLSIPTLSIQNPSSNTEIIDGDIIKAGSKVNILMNADVINEQFKADNAFLTSNYTKSADVLLKIQIMSVSTGSYPTRRVLAEQTKYIRPATSKKDWTWTEFAYRQVLDRPYKTRVNLNVLSYQSTEDVRIELRLSTVGGNDYTIVEKGGTTEVEKPFEDKVAVQSKISITGSSDINTNYKTLDQMMNKVIKSVNTNYGTDYYISNETQQELKDILVPELTFQSYTAWDALEKLSNLADAFPRVGRNNFNEIEIVRFNEDMNIEYDLSDYDDETQGLTYQEFNAGYEVNASNLIETDSIKNAKVEPYPNGWLTVRPTSEDIVQLTEANAGVRTRQPIHRVHGLKVRGVAVDVIPKPGESGSMITLYGDGEDGEIPTSTRASWDISNLVVEEQRWRTYENMTANDDDNTRLNIDTKGNHLYYREGSNFIYNLGYKTAETSTLLGERLAPRALFETIMRKVAGYLLENKPNYMVLPASSSDPEQAIVKDFNLFEGVQFNITYTPLTTSRLTLYKHNAFEQGVDSVKYMNEQDRINDTFNLGEYGRKTINKLGNNEYNTGGRVSSFDRVPLVGGIISNDNRYITKRTMNLHKNQITYDLELNKDFINQSTHVGIDSKHRQYEVPDDNIVFRQDKYTEFVVVFNDEDEVKKHNPTSRLNHDGKTMVFFNLSNKIDSKYAYGINYGKMEIIKKMKDTGETNTQEFDMPVNGLAIGTTIGLQLEMTDNYSAGPQIKTTTINGDLYKSVDYTRYTDFFGDFEGLRLTLHPRGYVLNSVEDSDKYPLTDLTSTVPSNSQILYMANYDVQKDAREKFGMTFQFPVLSGNREVRIFPGFAKYSALIRSYKDVDIHYGLLLKEPDINDTFISDTDIIKTELIESTNRSATWNTGIKALDLELKVPQDVDVKGLVIYHKNGDKNELILSALENLSSQSVEFNHKFKTLYFLHRTNLDTYLYPDDVNKVSVTFVKDNDEPNDVIYVDKGSIINTPVVNLAGYDFDGWFKDVERTDRFSNTEIIESNLVLYAKWIIKPVDTYIWSEINTNQIPVETIKHHYGTLDCPPVSVYKSVLPALGNYNEGDIVQVIMTRNCDSSVDNTCLTRPEDGTSYQECTTRKFYKRLI